jgi:hypothetical protein
MGIGYQQSRVKAELYKERTAAHSTSLPHLANTLVLPDRSQSCRPHRQQLC